MVPNPPPFVVVITLVAKDIFSSAGSTASNFATSRTTPSDEAATSQPPKIIKRKFGECFYH